MMENILLAYDMLAVRRWFSRQRGSKVAVIVGFFIVMLLTVVGAFSIGFVYFRNLAGFGIYGQATAAYLLHAAILVTGFLATGSAIASTLGFLFTKNKGIEYLKTLPVSDGVVLRWILIKSSIVSVILLSVLITPVLVSYAAGMHQTINLGYISRIFLLIISLVIVCQSLGSLIAFIVIPFIKERSSYIFAAGVFVMLLTVLALLKIIFPSGLARLYFSDPDTFWHIYNSLPLSNSYLPTLWFTLIVVSKDLLPIAVTFGLALLVAAISYIYQKSSYTSIYQQIHAAPFVHTSGSSSRASASFDTVDPLITKDIFAVLRTPSELSYVFFLVGLAAFFFMLILYTGSLRYTRVSLWGPGLITFSLGWLLFFTTAFLLRLVFPLMARERAQTWFIFTMPVSGGRVVIAKIMAGLIVSSLFIMFALLLWTIAPLSILYKIQLILWSIWSICMLVLIHASFGMIHPNFEDGLDPERVSTTFQGMTALAMSMLLIGTVCYVVYTQFSYEKVPVVAWLLFFVLSIGTPWYLMRKAYRSVKEYEF